LFIADNATYRVRKVTSGGVITTFAGTGATDPNSCTLSGDGDQATTILLCDANGLAIDGTGDVFFSEGVMNVVRKVTPAGVITTVAGNGTQGHSGDNLPATAAQLNAPGALTAVYSLQSAPTRPRFAWSIRPASSIRSRVVGQIR
jgi:hypothetical protein